MKNVKKRVLNQVYDQVATLTLNRLTFQIYSHSWNIFLAHVHDQILTKIYQRVLKNENS